MSRRKTVKVKDEKVSEVIERMLDGEIVEIRNGNFSRKICRKLKHLRKKNLLYRGYNQKKRCTYLWFDEKVDKETLKKQKKSLWGDIWEIVFPFSK